MLELELPLERQEEGRAAGWRLLSHQPCLQQNKPGDDGDDDDDDHTINLGDDCDDYDDGHTINLRDDCDDGEVIAMIK